MKNPVLAHFGPIFPIFGAKTIFLGNPALSRTTSHGNLAPCKDLEKLNNTIPRKDPDGRMDGRMDRPYFIGPFRLPPGVQQSMIITIKHGLYKLPRELLND